MWQHNGQEPEENYLKRLRKIALYRSDRVCGKHGRERGYSHDRRKKAVRQTREIKRFERTTAVHRLIGWVVCWLVGGLFG